MRRIFTTALFAALVGGIIGGMSLASASTARDLHHVKTLRLLEITKAQQQIDVGAKGPSPGDEFIFESVFRNPKGTRTLGHNQGICVAVLGGAPDCNGTATIPGGTLRFGQTVDFTTRNQVLAIVGGTGRYLGANGQVTIHNLNKQGTRSLDTIQLILPN